MESADQRVQPEDREPRGCGARGNVHDELGALVWIAWSAWVGHQALPTLRAFTVLTPIKIRPNGTSTNAVSQMVRPTPMAITPPAIQRQVCLMKPASQGRGRCQGRGGSN